MIPKVGLDRTFEEKIVEVTYPSTRVQQPMERVKKQIT
jgi:hypothetical protein